VQIYNEDLRALVNENLQPGVKFTLIAGELPTGLSDNYLDPLSFIHTVLLSAWLYLLPFTVCCMRTQLIRALLIGCADSCHSGNLLLQESAGYVEGPTKVRLEGFFICCPFNLTIFL
jgi:hypothetical protein